MALLKVHKVVTLTDSNGCKMNSSFGVATIAGRCPMIKKIVG